MEAYTFESGETSRNQLDALIAVRCCKKCVHLKLLSMLLLWQFTKGCINLLTHFGCIRDLNNTSLRKYGESSTTFLSCNEVQMDTLISNQRERSKKQEVTVRVHLPACLPAAIPLFILPVDELTGA